MHMLVMHCVMASWGSLIYRWLHPFSLLVLKGSSEFMLKIIQEHLKGFKCERHKLARASQRSASSHECELQCNSHGISLQ